MEKRLALVRETGRAIRHKSFTLGGANRDTQVSFSGFTEQTLAAFCRVKRNNMIARFHTGDPFADFHNNTRTFMTQYCREHTFRIITGQGKCISVADAGMGDFYQYFTLTRRLHINFNDLEGLTRANATAARDFICHILLLLFLLTPSDVCPGRVNGDMSEQWK